MMKVLYQNFLNLGNNYKNKKMEQFKQEQLGTIVNSIKNKYKYNHVMSEDFILAELHEPYNNGLSLIVNEGLNENDIYKIIELINKENEI